MVPLRLRQSMSVILNWDSTVRKHDQWLLEVPNGKYKIESIIFYKVMFLKNIVCTGPKKNLKNILYNTQIIYK